MRSALIPRHSQPSRRASEGRRRAAHAVTTAWIALLVAPPIAVTPAAADVLRLHGGTEQIEGATLVVNDDGVQFLPRRGEAIWYTWDRIRDLESESEDRQNAYEARREFADRLWRARSRLERGDILMAEPIFESLRDDAVGRTNRVALIIMEGLLRCRLAREAHAGAIIPWLETRRLLDQGVERVAYLEMPAVLDERTGLCPQLPPIWTTGPELDALALDLSVYAPAEPHSLASLADLYLLAARRAQGQETPIPSLDAFIDPESGRSDESVTIVWAFVVSVFGDPESAGENAEPLRRLDHAVRANGALKTWRLFGHGSALMASDEIEDAKKGLVALLEIPARFGDTDPYLAGFALERSAARLEALNRPGPAASLRDELSRRFSDHPVRRGDALAPPHSSHDRPETGA